MLPKGLVTLEAIFNSNDQARNKGLNVTARDDYTHVIVADGQTLNLGKVCIDAKQEVFINLCQEFNDVIAWTYEDLKGFDPNLFQHTIDLNHDAKLVRQKQRSVNPKIEPLKTYRSQYHFPY